MATGSKVKLAGKQRAQMVEFIQRPLEVWLRAHMKMSFPDPKGREAQDITAEAVALAISDVLSKEALEQIALEIIERKRK